MQRLRVVWRYLKYLLINGSRFRQSSCLMVSQGDLQELICRLFGYFLNCYDLFKAAVLVFKPAAAGAGSVCG